ncbi:hypothetical protein GF326_06495 [Candidatus Bathyarchaeota archaeon]|nr:hypothetical protein [Candidatus Bathyarchaeota archaeon]
MKSAGMSRVCFNPRGFKALLITLQDTYKSAGSAIILSDESKIRRVPDL